MSGAEASESCVGLSVSFPQSQFCFPSFLRGGGWVEEVKVDRGLKAGDERKAAFPAGEAGATNPGEGTRGQPCGLW